MAKRKNEAALRQGPDRGQHSQQGFKNSSPSKKKEASKLTKAKETSKPSNSTSKTSQPSKRKTVVKDRVGVKTGSKPAKKASVVKDRVGTKTGGKSPVSGAFRSVRNKTPRTSKPRVGDAGKGTYKPAERKQRDGTHKRTGR